MDVADLTGLALDDAFSSEEPDQDDGIVRATAELLGAEVIVTRDSSACWESSVPAMGARGYCERLGQGRLEAVGSSRFLAWERAADG